MKSSIKAHPELASRKKRRWKIILIIVGALICVRVTMPFVVLHYVNQKLAALDGYYGHCDDIDLRLYRGAYVMNDVLIVKVDSKDTTDFFNCPRVDLSVEWRAIFQKKLVGEVEFEKPVVKYIMGRNIGQGALKADTVNFIGLVDEFMPIRVNHFLVNDGEIHYIDYSRTSTVDLPMTHVNIEGDGLTNEADTTLLPATINMDAALFDGKFTAGVLLDPSKDTATFDLNLSLTNLDLTRFNAFFKAYANFDVEQGTMAMYVELAARDGEFVGYVKPLISDLKILEWSKEEGGPQQIAWEALVGGASEILTNQSQDQFATNIPVSGKFTDPNIDVMEAIIALLKNAFIKALQPGLENSITIRSAHQQQEKKNLRDRSFIPKGKDSR